MTVEDTTVSPIVATDRFTYSVAPTVTKLTPAIGPAKGGTRVTIWGGSFVGAVSVRFGAVQARDERASHLVVEAQRGRPPGRGRPLTSRCPPPLARARRARRASTPSWPLRPRQPDLALHRAEEGRHEGDPILGSDFSR